MVFVGGFESAVVPVEELVGVVLVFDERHVLIVVLGDRVEERLGGLVLFIFLWDSLFLGDSPVF